MSYLELLNLLNLLDKTVGLEGSCKEIKQNLWMRKCEEERTFSDGFSKEI